MRVLFSGGGTAGHVTPALAISEILEEEYKNYTPAFVGRSGGAENNVIERSGYKLFTLDIVGLRRSFSVKNIEALYKLIRSMSEAERIIDDFSPDIIIGTGGYVCYPIIKAGLKKKIPCLIHEANAYPGLVTRMLGRKCNSVMLGMKEAKNHLARCKNVITVGNPIRRDFTVCDKRAARNQLRIKDKDVLIVSFGGSLGSEVMNDVIIDFMQKYSLKKEGVRHIHSCGKAHYKKLKNKFPHLFEENKQCKIVPYIDNMPILLSAADISITRSGAMTIAELTSVSCNSILIPSPNVTSNHQLFNARAFAERGAATVIEEKELSVDRLIEKTEAFIQNKHRKKSSKDQVIINEALKCKRAILNVIQNTAKQK